MSEHQAENRAHLPTMEELLAEEAPTQELRRGEIVEGVVVRIDQDGILVSVGHKSEGVVPQREMRSLGADPAASCQVGQAIAVYVIDAYGAEGSALLSVDRARGDAAWEKLEAIVESGGTITGRIVGHNRGGAVVDIEGLQAFVPLSQTVLPPGEEPDRALAARVGEEVTLKALEINRRRNRAVLSERAAFREQREELKSKLLEGLEEGQTRHGRVTGVSSFGAFVDIGGADGLVHISEMSWSPVASVDEVLTVGQEVDVYVLRVDRESGRIALSLRRLQPTPWQTAAERFAPGQLVEGTITKLTDFGAFARVEDGVEGLIHISELTESHIRHPREAVSVGDTMTLRVISLDPARRRLGLSLRQVEQADDEAPREYRDRPDGIEPDEGDEAE